MRQIKVTLDNGLSSIVEFDESMTEDEVIRQLKESIPKGTEISTMEQLSNSASLMIESPTQSMIESSTGIPKFKEEFLSGKTADWARQAAGEQAYEDMMKDIRYSTGTQTAKEIASDLLPRTTKYKGFSISDLRNKTPDEAITSVTDIKSAKSPSSPMLDIATIPGRSAASVIDAISSNSDKTFGTEYSKSLGKPTDEGFIGSTLRDPLLPLMASPSGTILGELGLGSKAIDSASKLRKIGQTLGKGAAETAIETGIESTDRPVSTEENILPLLLNTAGFGLGSTPKELQNKAADELFSILKPTKTQQKSDSRLTVENLQKLMDSEGGKYPGIAKGAQGGSTEDIMLGNLQKRLDKASELEKSATETQAFKSKDIDTPELSDAGYSDIATSIQDNINYIDPNTQYPEYLPSQQKEMQKALDKIVPDLNYLQSLSDARKKTMTNGKPAEELGYSINDLISFRKKIDRRAEDIGAYSKQYKDISDEAKVYRMARDEINNKIKDKTSELNNFLNEQGLDKVNFGKPISKDALNKLKKYEDIQKTAVPNWEEAQRIYRDVLPWKDVVEDRGKVLNTNAKTSLLNTNPTALGVLGSVGKSLKEGVPLYTTKPRLSTSETQKLYDYAKSIGYDDMALQSKINPILREMWRSGTNESDIMLLPQLDDRYNNED